MLEDVGQHSFGTGSAAIAFTLVLLLVGFVSAALCVIAMKGGHG